MIKKVIKCKDFEGNQYEEECFFNLSKAECMEMELSTEGGVQSLIKQIIAAKDQAKLVELFKTMIMKSYGKKSPDGKRFHKSKEIVDDFVSSDAYSELFMELATNTDSAIDFIIGVLPVDPNEAKAALASLKAEK